VCPLVQGRPAGRARSVIPARRGGPTGGSTGGFTHRRAFAGTLTGLLGRPLAAEAPAVGKLARIGFLSPANDPIPGCRAS